MEGRKQTRGRQKIPIQLIQSQDDLYATFSKRRLGIYKKASELCSRYDVDIGIILSSPTGNPFAFFHPNMKSVVRRSSPELVPPSDDFDDVLMECHARGRVVQSNQDLARITAEKEAEKQREVSLTEDAKRKKNAWLKRPIESLGRDEVKAWMEWFGEFQARVRRRMAEMKGEGSSSAIGPPPPPADDGDYFPYHHLGFGSSIPYFHDLPGTGDDPFVGGGALCNLLPPPFDLSSADGTGGEASGSSYNPGGQGVLPTFPFLQASFTSPYCRRHQAEEGPVVFMVSNDPLLPPIGGGGEAGGSRAYDPSYFPFPAPPTAGGRVDSSSRSPYGEFYAPPIAGGGETSGSRRNDLSYFPTLLPSIAGGGETSGSRRNDLSYFPSLLPSTVGGGVEASVYGQFYSSLPPPTVGGGRESSSCRSPWQSSVSATQEAGGYHPPTESPPVDKPKFE